MNEQNRNKGNKKCCSHADAISAKLLYRAIHSLNRGLIVSCRDWIHVILPNRIQVTFFGRVALLSLQTACSCFYSAAPATVILPLFAAAVSAS
jgi:hypothetical protein